MPSNFEKYPNLLAGLNTKIFPPFFRRMLYVTMSHKYGSCTQKKNPADTQVDGANAAAWKKFCSLRPNCGKLYDYKYKKHSESNFLVSNCYMNQWNKQDGQVLISTLLGLSPL